MAVSRPQLFDRWAALYDAVYAAKGKDYRGEAARVLDLVRRRLPNRTVRSLLDVGCGTGEHLRWFREHLAVAGVDRSEAMLAVARRKLPRVRLEATDMTTMRLGRRFDVVTCLFATVGYLDDEAGLRAAICRMAEHLEPGGLLVVEPALTPDRVRPPRTSTMELTWRGAGVRRTTSARREGDLLRIRFEYEIDPNDGRIQRFSEEHPIRLFSDGGYRSAFAAAGLSVDHDPYGLTGLGLYLGRGRRAAPRRRRSPDAPVPSACDPSADEQPVARRDRRSPGGDRPFLVGSTP